MHSSGILPEFLTCFDKKICKEHRLRITDGIIIISKQLKSVL